MNKAINKAAQFLHAGQLGLASVKTASAVQVRQSIYTDSVRLWENYGEKLSPLKRALNSSVE